MKYLQPALALLVTLATALAVHAEDYARLGAGHFVYHNSHYENKTGVGLAVGSFLGASGNHALELEVDLVSWDANWSPTSSTGSGSFPAPIVAGGITTVGEGHLIPVLVGYRYRTGTAESIWRFYAGASLGATRIGGDLRSTQALPPPYGNRTGSVSTWRATVGGAIGVEVRLANRLFLDAGYQFRAVDGPTATLREVAMPAATNPHDLGNLSTSVFSLGLNWAF